MRKYQRSFEPPRIFWNDTKTASTRLPRVLPNRGWRASVAGGIRQHAWHSCWAGSIVISGNPQGLVSRSVHIIALSSDNRRVEIVGRTQIKWLFFKFLLVILMHLNAEDLTLRQVSSMVLPTWISQNKSPQIWRWHINKKFSTSPFDWHGCLWVCLKN